jgi:beta-glucuronidase
MRIALVLLLIVPSLAQTPSRLIADPPSRSTIALDGIWNSIVDPYESGLSSRFFENAKAKSKSDLIEYDFDRSPKLLVPGDWNTQRDALLLYEGPMWYQRYFSYPQKPHTRTFLYFGAANYLARVWLNGTKLGEHVGGFTPFDFEVTDKIRNGENFVVVEVDNTRRKDGVPGIHTDWWNYGGLTRGVKLVEVPETFVENYQLQLAPGRSDAVAGWVQLQGGKQGAEVTLEIRAADLLVTTKTARADASGHASFLFPVKLDLWSPENPKLYEVRISAEGDQLTDQVGFRTLATRGTQILLNGKPIFLRGISLHEEAPFRGARAFSEDDGRTLLSWAKDLGSNFVRLAHYPHNEDMIRLADRMGVMVWEEVPVYWELEFENPAVLENAKTQLDDTILRDQNRAAIVFWSIANETPISPARNAVLKSLSEYARSLDSTRLISAASDKWQSIEADTMALNDPLGEYLDVIGLNQYIGWYGDRKPEDADRIQWKFAYSKPVIVTEFGGGAQYGLHGDSATRFTEEYQANLYQHQLRMLSHLPQLAGMTPWILMDFRSPRRALPVIQDYYNRKGLISDRGQRKQAFYVLQKFYREKAQEARSGQPTK